MRPSQKSGSKTNNEEEMTDNKSSNRNSAAIARLELKRERERKLNTTDHCNGCPQNRMVRLVFLSSSRWRLILQGACREITLLHRRRRRSTGTTPGASGRRRRGIMMVARQCGLLIGIEIRRARRTAHIRSVDLRRFFTHCQMLLGSHQSIIKSLLPFDPGHFILNETFFPTIKSTTKCTCGESISRGSLPPLR